jgi:hypothetical protein
VAGIMAQYSGGDGDGYSSGVSPITNFETIPSIAPGITNLTITGLTANDKTYDGTTIATLSGGTLLGVVNNDIVILNNGIGEFTDANAGNNKTVNVSGFSISGSDAGKYNLVQPGSLSASIFKANVEINWSKPDDIESGTVLSSAQLNATVNSPGVFIYTPASGTILPVGNNQQLKVDFTPTDELNYNSASKSVYINVTPLTGFAEIDANKILFFPNPVVENVSISGLSSFFDNKQVNLSIVDIYGKTLLSKTLVNPLNIENINLASLQSGVYFLHINTNKEKIVKPFVKE